MVAKFRTVRLVDGAPGGGAAKSTAGPSTDEETAEDSHLQSLVTQQRRQQRLLFREMTGRIRRTGDDLECLSQLRQTAELKHPPPWSPELRGLEKLLTDEQAWREYERRYLFTSPSVQLPPTEEVDISLLTARITGEQPMLPAPGRGCAQGFYPPPGRGRLTYNESRQRSLLPGARLPNTVIIRLLWSTRTLLDVENYRTMENERTRRRQHWEFFEWSDSEEGEREPAECLDRLESVATRRRNRRKISMKKHEHLENWLHIAETGVDEGAVPDSEDEAIERARRRRLSRRGRLLSDVDDTPGVEGDAHVPSLSTFTPRLQPEGKTRRKKKPRGKSEARGADRRGDRDGTEDSLCDYNVPGGSSEYLHPDDNGDPTKAVRKPGGSVQLLRPRDTTAVESDAEGTHSEQETNRQVLDKHHQANFSLSQADDQVTISAPDSASSAAAGEPSRSVPPELSAPWTASERQQPTERLRLRRPTERAEALSPLPSTRERTSMSGGGRKHYLTTPRARPDVEANVSWASPAPAPPRRHALRMPYLFELKDYSCDFSKAADQDETEMGMSHGVKRYFCIQRAKQRAKSMAGVEAVGRMSQHQEGWSPSRLPGVFYDVKDSEDNEGTSEVAEKAGEDNIQHHVPFQQDYILMESMPPTSGESIGLRRLAVDYIQHLMQHEWAKDPLHGVSGDTLDPWEAAERLVKRMPKQPFQIQQAILQEVRTVHQHFPASASSLQSVSDGMLAILYPATEDVTTLTMVMDTLVSISAQMDVVLANILALLTLEKLEVTASIQLLLDRLGLIDPHHLVLAEALSWAPLGRRRSSETGRRETVKKALGFVETWTQAFESHSTLIAEEVNKSKFFYFLFAWFCCRDVLYYMELYIIWINLIFGIAVT